MRRVVEAYETGHPCVLAGIEACLTGSRSSLGPVGWLAYRLAACRLKGRWSARGWTAGGGMSVCGHYMWAITGRVRARYSRLAPPQSIMQKFSRMPARLSK